MGSRSEWGAAVNRQVHPIEARSYAILRDRIDTSSLPPLTRAVTERVVHASADLDYVEDLVCDEAALAAGRTALRAGAPVVTDVAMVAAGITRSDLLGDLVCAIGEPAAAGWPARPASPGRRRRSGSPPTGSAPGRSGWSAARPPRWSSCSGWTPRRPW